jgi:serine acetyltransferase
MILLKLLKPLATFLSWFNHKIDRLKLKKLMSQGLKIGKNVYIMEDVHFDLNYPFLIEIGDNCRISKDVRILAHDATTFRDLGITKVAPVKILEGTFIAEHVIILPGVTIGPRALITAGSVVNRDIGEGMAAAGNPARPYGKYNGLLNKHIELARELPVHNKKDLETGKIGWSEIITQLEETGQAYLQGIPKSDPWYINANFEEMTRNAEEAYKKIQKK